MQPIRGKFASIPLVLCIFQLSGKGFANFQNEKFLGSTFPGLLNGDTADGLSGQSGWRWDRHGLKGRGQIAVERGSNGS
jgi:hypothetical protein